MEDGLYFYRKIVSEAGRAILKPGGWLLYEIGMHPGGGCAVAMMREAGFTEVQIVKDLPGLDRVVWADVLYISKEQNVTGGNTMFDKLDDLLIRFEEASQ